MERDIFGRRRSITRTCTAGGFALYGEAHTHPSDSLGQQRRNKRRDLPISVLNKGMETLVHFSFPRGKRVANTLSILSPTNGAVSSPSPLLPPRPRHDSFV